MTRNFSILAAAATVAFLAFSAGEASAMNLGGQNRGGTPGGPAGPSSPSSHGNTPDALLIVHSGCRYEADQLGLANPARSDFVWRCRQKNGEF